MTNTLQSVITKAREILAERHPRATRRGLAWPNTASQYRIRTP
jgi:hypothetical protein